MTQYMEVESDESEKKPFGLDAKPGAFEAPAYHDDPELQKKAIEEAAKKAALAEAAGKQVYQDEDHKDVPFVAEQYNDEVPNAAEDPLWKFKQNMADALKHGPNPIESDPDARQMLEAAETEVKIAEDPNAAYEDIISGEANGPIKTNPYKKGHA